MKAYAKAGAFLVVGTCSMKLRRFVILSFVFVCFGTSGPAFAGTLVVDNDFADCPQADFSSIQAAVVAAQPGDKILACPGVYREEVSVDITKQDLRIEAQAAPGDVVLDGEDTLHRGFNLQNTTGVLVQGFTIKNFLRVGILIEGESGNTLESRNTLRKNVTTQNLIGIEVFNSNANVVEQNIAFDNTGVQFPGLFLSGTSTGNVFRHNEAFGNDLGIC
jgi:parallel beta-helix repeat protein